MHAHRVLAVADLAAFLLGRWAVARRIVDLRDSSEAAFEGEALVCPCPSGLGYAERGELRGTTYRGGASRAWTYVLREPGLADVRFPDGRPFHDLDLRTGRWEAEHRCGADVYRGGFAVTSPDAWTVRWSVGGPRKDLRLVTALTRRPVSRT